MSQIGLSINECAEYGIAPILFREETIFHKEIKMDEEVFVAVEMTKHTIANNRFSITHFVYVELINKIPKNENFVEH